jgi:NAD(P)-dependent dehydrogenase (short-subunit alcohol dehydrogenase family)
MAHWRNRAKSGAKVRASLIHTTSISGLAGNFGQANYAAAKLGIVALSRVAALEGASFGVRSNAVAPSARTRLAMSGTLNAEALFERPAAEGEFDHWDPDNVAPIIAWLAREDCPASSQIFNVLGRCVRVFSMPAIAHELVAPGRWTMEALDRELTPRLAPSLSMEQLLEVPK